MKKLTIFISGGGSNLAAIIKAIETGEIKDTKIIRVLADRDCQGKMHALNANIPFALIDRKLPKVEFSQELLTHSPEESDLIVLAGFLSVIPEALIEKFPNKIINLHPSLLPKYGGAGMYGIHVHRAVLENQETQTGCTIHYVDKGIDTGKIIAQSALKINKDDTPERLQQRLAPLEHQLLIETIKNLLKV